MGYWNSSREGTSLVTEDTGYIWGDGPADIMTTAIDQIRKRFREDVGREPTMGEIRAGLEFSLRKEPDETPATILDT